MCNPNQQNLFSSYTFFEHIAEMIIKLCVLVRNLALVDEMEEWIPSNSMHRRQELTHSGVDFKDNSIIGAKNYVLLYKAIWQPKYL